MNGKCSRDDNAPLARKIGTCNVLSKNKVSTSDKKILKDRARLEAEVMKKTKNKKKEKQQREKEERREK